MSEAGIENYLRNVKKAPKFDRCNPDEFMLSAVRAYGRRRHFRYLECANRRHESCCASVSLSNLRLAGSEEKLVYLDIGCGDSPDVLIAAALGYESHGIDLAPTRFDWQGKANFIKHDATEGLLFPDETVDAITSQAIIDLIEPENRLALYQEAYRILRPAGAFAQIGAHLSNGWGFRHQEEFDRASSVGFRTITKIAFGFIAVK